MNYLIQKWWQVQIDHKMMHSEKNKIKVTWKFVRRISVNLPQIASRTIYKSFIRPHLDESAKSRGFKAN